MRLFIPDKIELDEILSQFPPDYIENFDRDKLVYIISLIVSIPAGNSDLEIPNGYVPIHSKTLQNSVRNYKDYFKYLCDRGILDTDNWYIPGKKSTGYKFPFYWRRLKAIEIMSRSVTSAVRRENKWDFETKEKYSHLFKWWNCKLKIDYAIALDFLETDLAFKRKADDFKDRDHKTGLLKDPWQKYWNSVMSIERLNSKDYSLSTDQKGKRLYSPLTNLKSMLRNCVSYNNETLVSIDLKNSQPFLSTVLLKPSFWSNEEGTYSLKVKDFDGDHGDIVKTSIPVKQFLDSDQNTLNRDIQLYTELVLNGTFYEFMERELFSRLGITYATRKNLKGAILMVLYSDNKYFNQPEAAPKRVFAELFPTVYKIFAAIKGNDKSKLPVLLQQIESKMILEIITRRIDREKPTIPIFTIHDSIVTTVGNEGYVRNVLSDEMRRAIGFVPQLSTEIWLPENLRYKDETYYDIEPLIAKLYGKESSLVRN
jgi:hypothetical protein